MSKVAKIISKRLKILPYRKDWSSMLTLLQQVKNKPSYHFPSFFFFHNLCKHQIHSYQLPERIRNRYFEQDTHHFLQSKYNWDKPAIQNIHWVSHYSCYKSLSTNEKRNMSRNIYHRLPSGKMMFDLKYWCPHYILLPDLANDHCHFLTCINSRHHKVNRSVTLTTRLDKLHTPSLLRNLLLHHLDNYYNNELKHDLPRTASSIVLLDYITAQNIID